MTHILVDIFIIFVVAKLTGELFERLRLPAVIGEILAGVAIGPHALALVGQPGPDLVATFHDPAAATEALRLTYDLLAQLGVIVLLFFVGLQTSISDMLAVGRRAALVGGAGIVAPFALGYFFIAGYGYSGLPAVFMATAMVATSVGITARVLEALGVLGRIEARVIMGAAVIDDILGMILLAIVVAVGAGPASQLQIALVAIEAVAFAVFVLLVGRHVIPRYDFALEQLRARNGPFVVSMAACLGLAALAAYVGLAAIIGAFLAGMAFSQARQSDAMIARTEPVYDLLVPFFFVITGTQIDPRLFLDGSTMGLALVVTALAIVGKLVGCSLAAWGLPWRSVAAIGVGMVPRGEVGLIVASVGRSLGAIPDQLFSVVVIMSVLTTLVVPPVLRVIYGASRSAEHQTQQAKP